MRIEYGEAKRAMTRQERGLDFVDAVLVFAGPTLDVPDDRFDYGEVRIINMGLLGGEAVVMVWTQRGETRRIISTRYANERERKLF